MGVVDKCAVVVSNCTSSNVECMDESTKDTRLMIGVLCCIAASVGATGGNILQKKAQTYQASLPDDKKAPVLFSLIISWRWLLGLLLMVIVPLPFDAAAFALAPQSLITVLGGLTLVLTQMVGPRLLGEQIDRQEYFYGGVILVGVAIACFSGPTHESVYRLDDLLDKWGNPAFIALEVLVVAAIAAAWVAIKVYPSHPHQPPATSL
jgi:drug/metabolite transporter (DMT)-like permease